MTLVKKGARISGMDDYTLVGEAYLQWAGAVDPFATGFSSNKRAQRLDLACLDRLGDDRWKTVFDGIMTKSMEVDERVKKENPEWAGNLVIDIHRRAVIGAPEVLAYAKALIDETNMASWGGK